MSNTTPNKGELETMITMSREEAKNYIKEQEPIFLQRAKKNVNGKPTYICPSCGNGSGTDGDGIARYHKGYKCFNCGLFEDLIGLWKIDRNITDDSEAFITLYDYFNISIEEGLYTVDNSRQPEESAAAPTMQETDFTRFFLEANKNIEKTDYHRGISLETLNHYYVGFVENWKHPKTPYAPASPRLIIPVSCYSYIARDTRKNLTKEQDEFKKQKASGKENACWIFNSKIIGKTDNPIFIVEGEIDALSIIDVGAEAVGLGSTSNVRQFISLLQDRTPKGPFILALDNDDRGQEAQEKLKKALEEKHISYSIIDPFVFLGLKDANEALNKDREAFKENIERTILEAEERQQLHDKEEYYKKYSASNQLKAFRNDIANSDTKCISTGFIQLDRILDGGIYEGLYMLGAISGLGKTTFTLQMADQIAAAGTDVLFIALEMGVNELIAKSISRHTFINCYYNKKDTRNAKTARGITVRKRWANYSQEEKDVIEEAFTSYEKVAEHLFIYSGMFEIGIKEIKEIIERHKKVTGNVPVIIIDYLQILAPYEIRASDKQNIDYAVKSLKQISVKYKTPVIAISSFNRDNYTSPVGMSAFKESGNIEYSCDVLIGLQYAGMDYSPGEKATERIVRINKIINDNIFQSKNGLDINIEMKLIKNRNFPPDSMGFSFYPCFNFYEEKLEERKRETPNNEKWI